MASREGAFDFAASPSAAILKDTVVAVAAEVDFLPTKPWEGVTNNRRDPMAVRNFIGVL